MGPKVSLARDPDPLPVQRVVYRVLPFDQGWTGDQGSQGSRGGREKKGLERGAWVGVERVRVRSGSGR